MAETKTKSNQSFYRGTGRRKTSVARVRVMEGSGQFTVNGRTVEDFFCEQKDRGFVYGPLDVTDLRTRLDVIADVHGGGFTGQAGAVSQGLARAIKEMFTGTEEGEGKPDEAPAPAAPPVVAVPSGYEEDDEEDEEEKKPDEAAAPTGGIIRRLRDSGYLTRDSRMKERKKYGRKGARRSFQFSKR